MTDVAAVRLRVIDPSGLHARPAARFVQSASRFGSRITILNGGKRADAKSLIAILGLALRPGTEIELEAVGPDADVALAQLTAELEPYVELAIDPTPAGEQLPA